MSELLPRPSLLGRSHADACKLGQAGEPLSPRRDLLFGTRGIKRPMVALVTKQNMGPCRHALAQMVVAGVMTVHPPLRPGQAPPTPANTEPRVLTFTPPPREPEPGRRPSAPTQATPTQAAPTQATPRPTSPAPASPGRPGERVVTYERTIIADFNPATGEDE
jgi:hypothetical protein